MTKPNPVFHFFFYHTSNSGQEIVLGLITRSLLNEMIDDTRTTFSLQFPLNSSWKRINLKNIKNKKMKITGIKRMEKNICNVNIQRIMDEVLLYNVFALWIINAYLLTMNRNQKQKSISDPKD